MNEGISMMLSVTICELIQSGDISGLKKLGLNSKIIKQIKGLSVVDMPVLIQAINSTTTDYKIDVRELGSTISSIQAINNKQNFINLLVKSGASYYLIRNFFWTYTNREHSKLRKQLDNPIILFSGNDVDESALNNYFYDIESKADPKGSITINDIYQYHKEHKVSINTVWRLYGIYKKDSDG